MLALDRGHLAATQAAAFKQDERLRAFVHELSACSAATGSVAELVHRLREQGSYWERVQVGRLRTVKRTIARLMQPFFKPQIRYNLMLAEAIGRVEVSLGELRREIEQLRDRDDHSHAP